MRSNDLAASIRNRLGAAHCVDDAVAAGMRKALIIVGHIPSEQAGMQEFARWLEPRVKGTPVTFIAAKEPFWSPK